MSEMTTNNTFDGIFRSFYSRLLRYASLMVSPDDAKDVVQGVFVWLLQHPSKMLDLQNGGGATLFNIFSEASITAA